MASSDSDAMEAGDTKTNVQTDKKELGMISESKDLYRNHWREPWEEWAPEDIGLPSTSELGSAKFALIVRREKENGDDSEPVLALHSITIQSPLLKAQLGPVFVNYRGINTNLKKLQFSAPFHEFYYRWTSFLQAAPAADEQAVEEKGKQATPVAGEQVIQNKDDSKREEKPETNLERKHYDLLFNVLHSEIAPHIERMNDLLKNNVISFDYLWALFEPGTEIYSKVDGHDRLFLFDDSTYMTLPNGSKLFRISCRYIDTDGDSFGYAETTLTISEFNNLVPVSDLTILPSHLVSSIHDIKERLQKRGRRFAELKGLHVKNYSGTYLLRKPRFGVQKQTVDNGRVIIDCSSFLRYNGETAGLTSFNESSATTLLDSSRNLPFMDDSDSDTDAPPSVQLLQYWAMKAKKAFAANRQDSKDTTMLSEDYYRLCTHRVKGYSLTAKEWVYLDISCVQDIVWNDKAFDKLVLDDGYKRMILAFVQAQLSNVDDFDDIIRGKGKGIIMLLSGEPGTGKTLTSESVAEAMRKPLYSMSAGELGHDAEELETKLRQVLELSARWNAVLLLDECDVFLEQRSASDLHRNKLVSVFLRLFEYYEGVMFLTTNRISSFDPAFESRIHLTIHFPPLDLSSRERIWRTFLPSQQEDPTGSATIDHTGRNISDQDLSILSQAELNGRQIKNVVKTARLLAASEKSALTLEHLQTVLKVKSKEAAALRDSRAVDSSKGI